MFLAPSDPEAKVLDYQTQQHKLFPQLATAYAFHFLGTSLQEFFQESYRAILDRDFSLLPEVPAVCWWAEPGGGSVLPPRGPSTCSFPSLLASHHTSGTCIPTRKSTSGGPPKAQQMLEEIITPSIQNTYTILDAHLNPKSSEKQEC